ILLVPYPPTGMRVICLFCLAALSIACAGPHSTGALWAQQSMEQEQALFQMNDDQRGDRARAFELGVADEALSGERQRISMEIEEGPGPRQTLGVSPGARARDAIRVDAHEDASTLMDMTVVAVADWY